MVAVLLGCQAAAGLLWRGAEDPRVLGAVLVGLIAGFGTWCFWGTLRGRLPLPGLRPTFWAGCLALAALIPALTPTTRASVVATWAAMAAGAVLFPTATLLSQRDRRQIEFFLRIVGWIVVLVAAHQRFNGLAHPISTFPSADGLAAAALLLIPFAVRGGDAPLVGGFLLCLWWTRSLGAWLGLSVALLAHRRAVGAFAFWLGAIAGFVVLVTAYARLGSPEFIQRWEHWKAAWPAAHEWPSVALWIAGLGLILRRAPPAERFGPVAALVQGAVDFPMRIPGVFWLFCLSAAWPLAESEDAIAVPPRCKIPALWVVAALTMSAVYAAVRAFR